MNKFIANIPVVVELSILVRKAIARWAKKEKGFGKPFVELTTVTENPDVLSFDISDDMSWVGCATYDFDINHNRIIEDYSTAAEKKRLEKLLPMVEKVFRQYSNKGVKLMVERMKAEDAGDSKKAQDLEAKEFYHDGGKSQEEILEEKTH